MLNRLVRGTIAAALVASGATVALSASPAYAAGCSVSFQTTTPAYMGNLVRTSASGSVSCTGASGTWGLHHDLYRNGRVYRTWSYTRTKPGTVYSTKDISCVSGVFHSVVRLGYGGTTSQSVSGAININC